MTADLFPLARAAYEALFAGEPPTPVSLVTFIDAAKVDPVIRHSRPTFGDVWIRAGATYAGKTQGGLLAFTWGPDQIPDPEPALRPQIAMDFA